MRHLESAHQQQVIEWVRWASRSAKYPMLDMLHGSNTLTDNQKKFLQNAANVGFAVSVCYSAQEAIKRIEDYYKD